MPPPGLNVRRRKEKKLRRERLCTDEEGSIAKL